MQEKARLSDQWFRFTLIFFCDYINPGAGASQFWSAPSPLRLNSRPCSQFCWLNSHSPSGYNTFLPVTSNVPTMKPPFLLISYQGFDQSLMHSSSSLPSWPRGRQFPHSGGRRLGRLGPWHSEKLLVILDLPLRLTGLWMFVPLSKTRVITSITPWITMVHHTAVYCGCTGCNLESMGSTWVSVLEPGCQVADVTYPKKHRVLFRALRGIPCASKFFHSLFNSVLSLCYGTWHVEQ